MIEIDGELLESQEASKDKIGLALNKTRLVLLLTREDMKGLPLDKRSQCRPSSEQEKT